MERFTYFVLLAGVLAARVGSQASSPEQSTARVPQFTEYPARSIFTGKPAPPVFQTPGQGMFRTMLREQAKGSPNCAGHYVIATWGCGTGCISVAIIDQQTGTVRDGPFGTLPRATLYLGPPPDPDSTGLLYRSDSRLLIARGCPNHKDCGAYFYEW